MPSLVRNVQASLALLSTGFHHLTDHLKLILPTHVCSHMQSSCGDPPGLSPGLLCVHICGPWSCSLWFYGISVAIGQTHQCYADDTQLYLIYSAASPASVNALRLLIQCIKHFVDLTPGSEHNSVCRLWGEGGSQYQPCSPSLRAPVILKSAIKVKLFLTLLT